MNLTVHVEGKISKNPLWIAEVFYGEYFFFVKKEKIFFINTIFRKKLNHC